MCDHLKCMITLAILLGQLYKLGITFNSDIPTSNYIQTNGSIRVMSGIFCLLISERRNQSSVTAAADPLLQMAQQVKEVLPHVPINAIRADLGK